MTDKCINCGGRIDWAGTWVARHSNGVCHRCGARCRVLWGRIGLYALATAALGVGVLIPLRWIAHEQVLPRLGARPPDWTIFALGLGPLMTAVLVAHSTMWFVLRRYPHKSWPDLCARCHYDLRGIESDKCPECRAEIERPS